MDSYTRGIVARKMSKARAVDLDVVFMIRCNSRDLARWKKRAAELGYGGAAAWIRKAANDAFVAGTPSTKRSKAQP